jgi:hypothetical protein
VLASAPNSDRFNLYVGLIGGGSALLGALVGGVVSGRYTLKGEEKRQRFAREEAIRIEESERRRLDDEARGVAMAMAADFLKAHWWLFAARELRVFSPDHPFTVPPQEDRKLVGSRLSPEVWAKVVSAEALVESLVRGREGLKGRVDAGGWDAISGFVDSAITALEEAQDALSALTGSKFKIAPLVPGD